MEKDHAFNFMGSVLPNMFLISFGETWAINFYSLFIVYLTNSYSR